MERSIRFSQSSSLDSSETLSGYLEEDEVSSEDIAGSKQDGDSSSRSGFEFINISEPSQALHRNAQKIVRRAASRHVRLLKATEKAAKDGTPIKKSRSIAPSSARVPVGLNDRESSSLSDPAPKKKAGQQHPRKRTATRMLTTPKWTTAYLNRSTYEAQALIISYYYPRATYMEVLGMIRDEPWPLNLRPDYSKMEYVRLHPLNFQSKYMQRSDGVKPNPTILYRLVC